MASFSWFTIKKIENPSQSEKTIVEGYLVVEVCINLVCSGVGLKVGEKIMRESMAYEFHLKNSSSTFWSIVLLQSKHNCGPPFKSV